MTSQQHEAQPTRDHQVPRPACQRACNTTRGGEQQRQKPYPVGRGRARDRAHCNKTSKRNKPRRRKNSKDRRWKHKKKTTDVCDITQQDANDNGISQWERLAETLGKKQSSCNTLDPYPNILNSEVFQPTSHSSKVSTKGTPFFSSFDDKDQRDPDTCRRSDENEKTPQDFNCALMENPSSQESAPADNFFKNPSQILEGIVIKQKEEEKSQTGLFHETGDTKNTEMCNLCPSDTFMPNWVQEQEQINISIEEIDPPQARPLFPIEPLMEESGIPEQDSEGEERSDAYYHEKRRQNSRNMDPEHHPVQGWPILQQSRIHKTTSQTRKCEGILEKPESGSCCICRCFCYQIPTAPKQVTGKSSTTPTESEEDNELLSFDGSQASHTSYFQQPCQGRRCNPHVFLCHRCSKFQQKELKNIYRCLRQQTQKLQKLTTSWLKADYLLPALHRGNERQENECVCKHSAVGRQWSKETLRYRSRSPPRDSQKEDVHQQMESGSHHIRDQQKEERGEQHEQWPMDSSHIHQDIISNQGEDRCIQYGLFAQPETPTDNSSCQYLVCLKKAQHQRHPFLLKACKGKATLHQVFAKVAPLSVNEELKGIGQTWNNDQLHKEPASKFSEKHSSLQESPGEPWDILQPDSEEEDMDTPPAQETREGPTPSSEIKPIWGTETELCHVKIESISNINCPNWGEGVNWQSHSTQQQEQNDKSMSTAEDYRDEETEEDTDEHSGDLN